MRVLPLLLLVSCAPAAEERRVAAPPPTLASAAPSTSASVAIAEAPPEKGDAPPSPIARTPVQHRLAADAWQTCLLRANGTVTCWGAGALVAPSVGLKGGLTTPVRPATIANLTDAVELAVSAHMVCARKKGGTVACWGAGDFNKLALSRTTATELPNITGVTRVFAGGGTALTMLAGDSIVRFDYEGKLQKEPLPVAGSAIIDVSAARDHTCLVANDGAVHCWGSNSLGAVGGVGKFVRVPGIEDAIAVSTDDSLTCVVRASGYRACWGNGHHLPGGYDKGKYPVVTDKKQNDHFRVAAGRTTCWLHRDKRVFCEGEGKYGQHGDGTTNTYANNPVAGLTDAVEIAVGFDHACALRANDEVVCWGANDNAQLGDGTLIDRTRPIGVLGLGGKEPPPPAKPGSGPPLALVATSAAKASWREDEVWGYSKLDHPFSLGRSETPTTFGSRAALFQGGLAFHVDRGLLGPIVTPKDSKLVALDGSDALWVGTKDSLSRAADLVDAKNGKFQKVLSIPYAADFSVTDGMVVAADASTLHITRDSGKTFTKVKPAGDLSIDEVYARNDGLIAVVGSDKAGERAFLIAKDGAAFTPSVFMPKNVQQIGSHIYGNGCPGGILSSDGKTWNEWDGEYGSPFSGSEWGSALNVSAFPGAFSSSSLKTHTSPPAPAPDKQGITGKPGSCQKGGLGGVGMGGFGRGRRRGGACSGVTCVRASIGEEPRNTNNQVGFYTDGACDRDGKGLCQRPFKRWPHVWMTQAKAPIDLPAGCAPIRILTAGGIGVLLCENDAKTHSVYTIAKDGVFHAEGTVAALATDAITIASDGTLLIHPVCNEKAVGPTAMCPAALVRNPVALGTANAWRSVGPAFAYRVLPGGAALTIGGDGDLKVQLAIDRAGKSTPWGPAITLTADLLDLDVLKDRVVLIQQMTSRKEFKSYVAADGLVRQE